MKTWIVALAMTVMSLGSAFGYDNGPQTIGCDYKLGKYEGTTKCLVIGSGTNQGTSWVVFEVQRKRFRFDDSSPNGIQLIEVIQMGNAAPVEGPPTYMRLRMVIEFASTGNAQHCSENNRGRNNNPRQTTV